MKQFLISNWKSIFKYVCIGIIGAILWSIIPKCSNEVTPVNNDVKKQTIANEKKQADSIQIKVVYKDSIRTVYVHKWHTIRHDSLIPCEEKLAIADTIILVDSSLISSLKAELFIKDLIIVNQDSVIVNDSIAYRNLNKKLKRQKFKTKLVTIGLGALLGVSLLR